MFAYVHLLSTKKKCKVHVPHIKKFSAKEHVSSNQKYKISLQENDLVREEQGVILHLSGKSFNVYPC